MLWFSFFISYVVFGPHAVHWTLTDFNTGFHSLKSQRCSEWVEPVTKFSIFSNFIVNPTSVGIISMCQMIAYESIIWGCLLSINTHICNTSHYQRSIHFSKFYSRKICRNLWFQPDWKSFSYPNSYWWIFNSSWLVGIWSGFSHLDTVRGFTGQWRDWLSHHQISHQWKRGNEKKLLLLSYQLLRGAFSTMK